MGLEDNMIEDGFGNEEDYLEHLINETERRVGYSRFDEEIDDATLQNLKEEGEERIEKWRYERMIEDREATKLDCWEKSNPILAAIWKLCPYSHEDWDEEYGFRFNSPKYRKAYLGWAEVHSSNMASYHKYFTKELLDEIHNRRLIRAYSSLVFHYVQKRKVFEYAPILRDWLNEYESRKETFFKEIALPIGHDDTYFNSVIWDENINEGHDLFYDTILNPGRWETFFNSIQEKDLESAWEQWVDGNFGSNFKSFLKKHTPFWMDAKKTQQKINDESLLWEDMEKASHDNDSAQLAEEAINEISDGESEVDTYLHFLEEYESRIDPDVYANKALFDLWKKEEPECWNSWKKEYVFSCLYHKDNYSTLDDVIESSADPSSDWFFYIIQNIVFKRTISQSWIDSHKDEWNRFLNNIDYEKYKEEITLASALDKWARGFLWGEYYVFPSTSTSFFISFMELFIKRKPELVSILDETLNDEFEDYLQEYYGCFNNSSLLNKVLTLMKENNAVKDYVEAMFNVYLAKRYDLLDPEWLMNKDYGLY